MDRKTYEKASEIVSRIDEIEKELTRIRTRIDEYLSRERTTVLGAKLVVKFREYSSEYSWVEAEEEFDLDGKDEFDLDGKDLVECLSNRANRLEEIYQRGISEFDKL